MNKKGLGIGSVLMVSLAVFWMINTPYHPPIGDLILKRLGVRAWSNGENGFHLTVLYSVPFIILGSMGIKTYLYKQYPKTYNKGVWIVLGIVVILVMGSSAYLKLNKSIQPGLKAIQFIDDKSEYTYHFEGEKIIEFKGTLTFKNHSGTSRSFYISYIPENNLSETIHKKQLLAYELGGDNLKLIEIQPNATVSVEVDFNRGMNLSRDYGRGGGSGSIETIVIYNNEEQVKFTEDNFVGIQVNQ